MTDQVLSSKYIVLRVTQNLCTDLINLIISFSRFASLTPLPSDLHRCLVAHCLLACLHVSSYFDRLVDRSCPQRPGQRHVIRQLHMGLKDVRKSRRYLAIRKVRSSKCTNSVHCPFYSYRIILSVLTIVCVLI